MSMLCSLALIAAISVSGHPSAMSGSDAMQKFVEQPGNCERFLGRDSDALPGCFSVQLNDVLDLNSHVQPVVAIAEVRNRCEAIVGHGREM